MACTCVSSGMLSVFRGEVNPLVPDGEDIAVALALDMRLSLSGTDKVICRNHLDGDAERLREIPVAQNGDVRKEARALVCAKDRRVLFANEAHCEGVQVVDVMMGQEHQIRTGKSGVVGQRAPGVHMDGLPAEFKHEGAVADECHGQIASGSFDDILFEIGCGRRCRDEKKGEKNIK